MKKFLAVCVVAAAALSPAVASAAKSSTTEGKTVSYAAGKLTVTSKKGTFKYLVGKKTDCGYSQGQMGDSMPCSNLKKSKYLKKSVTVNYHLDSKKNRVADLVAVHL